MRTIFLTFALWVCFLTVSGQVAVPDTIYIYEMVIVYDTIVIRDTVRFKRTMDMPMLQAIDIIPFTDKFSAKHRSDEVVPRPAYDDRLKPAGISGTRYNLVPTSTNPTSTNPTEKKSSPTATFSENSIILHENNNHQQKNQKEVKTMKMNLASNLSAIILTAQTMSGLLAQENKQEGDLKFFPMQFSFVYPMTTQGNQTVNYRYSLSFNLLSGKVGAVQGIEFGGLFNYAGQTVKGVQFAGITNATESVLGVQFGGIANICKEATGGRFAGIANVSEHTKGAQFAGIANISEKSEGVQFAGIANISQEVSGVSFSGVLNRTGTLRGAQFGLVNVIDTIESGVSIALVNIVKKGFYREWSLTFADYQNVGLNFKMGTQKFYMVLSAGANFVEDKLWVYGFGLGHRTPINQRFDFQPEIVAYQYLPQDFKNIRNTSATHLKLGFICKLNNRLGLAVAPSLYYLNSEVSETKLKTSPIPPVFEFESSWNEHGSNGEKNNHKYRHAFGAGISIGIIFRN